MSQKNVSKKAEEPPKGKDAVTESGEGPSKKTVTSNDEFLRIIKKRDYKVVDQSNHTPTNISIMYFFMSFKAHKTALLKLLNEAYLTEDINVNQFNNVVANLSVSSCLMFTNADLPPNGREHNMDLYISIKCDNMTLD